MTQNQVRYYEFKEQERHNRAMEALTDFQNRELNRANQAKELENSTHNRATEGELNRHQLSVEGETHRSNVRNESISAFRALEDQRHNKSSESVSAFNALEGQRHNTQTEGVSNMEAVTHQGEALTNYEDMLTRRSRAKAQNFQDYTRGFSNVSSTVRNLTDAGSSVVNSIARIGGLLK